VDVRHIDPEVTERMRVEMHEALATAAEEARVGFEIVTDWFFGDVAFDPDLTALVRQTAEDIGVPAMDIHSQAGHDAYCVSDSAPAILLFSPCVDGITHNEAEDVIPEDTWPSVNVLLQAVLRRADRD
jgi:N-carbamoyl-L-amino-acid hydrolase